jgi:hypothetical protein
VTLPAETFPGSGFLRINEIIQGSYLFTVRQFREYDNPWIKHYPNTISLPENHQYPTAPRPELIG